MLGHDYLDAAMRDCGRVELRHDTGTGWACGLFDDVDALRLEVARRADAGNLYVSLNAPKPRPAPNVMRGQPLRDDDIGYHVRLPFDFDPVRPKGLPSTDAELRLAVAARDRLVATLHGLGWPRPATAVSGNGAHALYRWRCPAKAETRDMLAALYRGLADDFGTEAVDFDTTVRNPARIWRLYGTRNRKGTPTPERPHRPAIVTPPSRWEVVSPRAVERLATSYARCPIAAPGRVAGPARGMVAPKGAGDFATLDAARWFAEHGAYRRALGGGKHAVRCPWDSEHSTVDPERSTASVIWEAAGGWPTFHCSHQHCEGRSLRDVLALWGDADRFCAREWRAAR